MDTSRPCNSKSRAINRYTRKELTELAKKKGIKDISKKTIDELCKEISAAAAVTKPVAAAVSAAVVTKPVVKTLLDPARACGKPGPNKYSRTELVEIAKKAGISTSKMMMSEICSALRKLQAKPPIPSTPTPNPHKCLIDINRPCGTKGPNKYTLKEVKELWTSECKDLPEFKKIKPATLKVYCSILHKRYDLLMLSAVYKIPETIKETLIKLSHNVKLKMSLVNFIYVRLKVYNDLFTKGNHKNISDIMADNEKKEVKNFRIDLIPPHSVFNKTFFINRPNSLYNKNVISFSALSYDWIKAQNDYIFGLSWEDKMRTLTYTYGGDKIANSYLLGNNISITDIMSKFTQYEKGMLFPLAVDIYLDAQKFKSCKDWADTVFVTPEFIKPDTLSLFTKIKSSKYNINVYNAIIEVLIVYKTYIKQDYMTRMVVAYINGLTKVINNAPPVPKDGIFVYRGVTSSDYVKTNKNNVFVNNSFMSTSLSIYVALRFKTEASKCCLFAIQVLPGARCLLATPISYYHDEIEILFAPGKHMFVTKTEKEPTNAKILVTHFALTN
jgi:hypothetical protein